VSLKFEQLEYMKTYPISTLSLILFTSLHAATQVRPEPRYHYKFDGNLREAKNDEATKTGGGIQFYSGISAQSLRLDRKHPQVFLDVEDGAIFSSTKSFTVQFWVSTPKGDTSNSVLLTNKGFKDKTLASQKGSGFSFYTNHGTWAWSLGGSKRRLTYQRDNGKKMPINDGHWHQVTMTFDAQKSEFRLYHDGRNTAIYSIGDTDKFDFSGLSKLTLGSHKSTDDAVYSATVKDGAKRLATLVVAYNALPLAELQTGELIDLVVDPKRFIAERKKLSITDEKPSNKLRQELEEMDTQSVLKLRSALMKNQYTVYQVRDYMEVAAMFRLYSLKGREIMINVTEAKKVTNEERFSASNFLIDELMLWDVSLSSDQVFESFTNHVKKEKEVTLKKKRQLTSVVWNIHHGGLHSVPGKTVGDPRKQVVAMLKAINPDVIMLQETYSSGDFIAAELGYYLVESADLDYLNQGANISVLSRYPIKEIFVPKSSSFMNIAALIQLSETQKVHVMSNWYGMNSFKDVYTFHKGRLDDTDEIPVLFGGDFNAIPESDGGKSLAARTLIEVGFADAYRKENPDPKTHPGFSYESGKRIDQLYYKGSILKHRSTKTISQWEAGFPSDHYIIKSIFDLAHPSKK